MTGCSVLRTGPVLVANEVHTEAGGSTVISCCVVPQKPFLALFLRLVASDQWQS